MHYKISLLDGKYTYVFDEKGQRALRNGEPWRELAGDKFVYAMAMRISELEAEVYELRYKLNCPSDVE